VYVTDDGIDLIFYDPHGDFFYNDYFNDHGLFFHGDYFVHMVTDDLSETDVTWEYNVLNDDQVSSTPTISISAYPNPFRQSLSISLNNTSKALDEVSIYNIKGQLVRSWKDIKTTELIWDGRNNDNQPFGSGIYLIRAKQGSNQSTIKVLKLN
jgi:hypothetical protein